ncbi:MAG TPA: XRE family transcriptional regulator [Tepidisphaeraceae bacterium]|jgi:transcriptional regulator with XRE-family HTH domain/SOS-response transcriptional repressor LexA|nr:XRE family transcriptional regulator [Tepidisphaeraceae bacterium]
MENATLPGRPPVTESLGPKIRRQRLRLGLTLDELAGRAGISKPYLSLIETARVANPPSDEKLRRLEQTLGFPTGELLTQAHLQRTPKDVRAVLHRLMAGDVAGRQDAATRGHGDGIVAEGQADAGTPRQGGSASVHASPRLPIPASSSADDAYFTGVLREMAGNNALGHMTTNAVPVINRASGGYPRDFTDLNYPPRAADEYLSCPDVIDRAAFAARVHGDNMTPKYRPGDIVVFSPALSARDGDDCFIRFADGQTTFLRVFFETGENNHAVLRLQPRNERHRARIVPSEQVAGLHKAVYRYQRVDDERGE